MSDDLKPAAWLYTPTPDRPVKDSPFCQPNRANMDPRYWTETPLYSSDRIEALTAENERLREAHWFYLGDDCSSDQCRFGIDECISEDFEWDNPAKGDHVLQVSGARPVPDMWVALHYFTDAEKDERNDDEPYSYTVHATEAEARAALAEKDEQ